MALPCQLGKYTMRVTAYKVLACLIQAAIYQSNIHMLAYEWTHKSKAIPNVMGIK